MKHVFILNSMHDIEVLILILARSRFALGTCYPVISQDFGLPDHHTYVVILFCCL